MLTLETITTNEAFTLENALDTPGILPFTITNKHPAHAPGESTVLTLSFAAHVPQNTTVHIVNLSAYTDAGGTIFTTPETETTISIQEKEKTGAHAGNGHALFTDLSRFTFNFAQKAHQPISILRDNIRVDEE